LLSDALSRYVAKEEEHQHGFSETLEQLPCALFPMLSAEKASTSHLLDSAQFSRLLAKDLISADEIETVLKLRFRQSEF